MSGWDAKELPAKIRIDTNITNRGNRYLLRPRNFKPAAEFWKFIQTLSRGNKKAPKALLTCWSCSSLRGPLLCSKYHSNLMNVKLFPKPAFPNSFISLIHHPFFRLYILQGTSEALRLLLPSAFFPQICKRYCRRRFFCLPVCCHPYNNRTRKHLR